MLVGLFIFMVLLRVSDAPTVEISSGMITELQMVWNKAAVG
jgi:hypothetical protein